MSAIAHTPAPAHTDAAHHHHHEHGVYVGQLSATTTEPTVHQAFTKTGVHVNHVSLKKARTFQRKVKDAVASVVETVTGKESETKSEAARAYAFVWLKTEADAQKAVNALNATTIDGHEIKVEIATEKPARAPRVKHEKAETPAAAGAVGAVTGAVKSKKSRRPKATNGETVHATEHVAKEHKPRAPRTPRGPPTGEPSETQLFVANLPFNVDDAALKALFTSYGAKVEHAEIKHSKFGRKASKGYGFVTFADHASQQLALTKAVGHKFGEREMTVKVAIQGDHAHGTQTPVVA